MNKIATIKILDEINAIIIGLDPRDIAYFYDNFGIYAKGYFFNPDYKLGRWDGKIRFFTKGGKTYVQLLPEIIEDLKKFEYKLKLIDNRKYFDINIPQIDKDFFKDYPDTLDSSKPFILANHQIKAINAATQANIGIVLGATAMGKTACCAALVKLYKIYQNYRCLVIVPTKDLVIQTREDIAYFGNDVGIYSGDQKDIEHDHIVSTWQALKNNKQLVTLFNAIIVDECHGAKATEIRSIINDFGGNAPIKLGLTGTLPKDPSDLMNIRVSLGNVLCEIPAHELITNGWLATLNLKILQLEEDLRDKWIKFTEEYPEDVKKITYKKFKNEYFPDYKAEMAYLKAHDYRNTFIVNLIETVKELSGNCLILVNGISYGRKLAKMIPGAHFIYGADKNKVRKDIYNLYSTKDDVVVVTSYQIGSTGLNIRRIFNLFLIDSERSFTRVIQSIGRGLRKASDKNSVTVYDVGSDLHTSRNQLNDRKKYYKDQKYKFTEQKIDYLEYIKNN